MKALVTGSGGFLGRHFVAELERRGWDAIGWELADGHDAMHLFSTDVMLHLDLVVHCAAQGVYRVAIDGRPATHIHNRMLDAAMFNWAIRTGARRVLYPSSCAVLDEQPDDYGLVKLAGERMAELARNTGLAVTVVRPYSGYGEDQGTDWPFGAFVARVKRRDDPVTVWGDGRQTRDWIHVDDIVNGALAAADADITEPVSLCTGEGTSMLRLVALLTMEARYQPGIKFELDAPAGKLQRVGDPTLMRTFYQPEVSLTEGVMRALA